MCILLFSFTETAVPESMHFSIFHFGWIILKFPSCNIMDCTLTYKAIKFAKATVNDHDIKIRH